jgi:ABC-2 type transport system ATP-binding protein
MSVDAGAARSLTYPGQVVAVDGLTKRFGKVLAVDNLSFTVRPGRVTGFLGPNGAGKTTTLRILLGLVRPTSGRATIGERRYSEIHDPLRTVGASLEATGFHSGRSARNHLRVLAATVGLPDARVDEVLGLVGLADVAGRRVGGFSLGMRQRLALAAALLGDPAVLLLDEPANGLDPGGIAWLRGFLRFLAGQGRTVVVSSHVLSEVQQTVDDVVIVSAGRLVRQSSLAELEGSAAVLVRTPTPDALVAALAAQDLSAVPALDADDPGPGVLRVATDDPATVGGIAFRAGVELHELTRQGSDLEKIFLSLTATPLAVPGAPESVAAASVAPASVAGPSQGVAS